MAVTKTRTQLKLWVLLTCAFTIVGVSAVAAIATLSISRARADAASDLTIFSKMLSVQFSTNADVVETAEQPTDLRFLNNYIERIHDQGLDFRRIQVFRKSGNYFQILLDSDTPDTKFLRNTAVGKTAEDVAVSGIPFCDTSVLSSEEGRYQVAYSAVFSPNGKVVGLVVVERSVEKLDGSERLIRKTSLLIAGIVFLLSAFLSIIVVRQLVSAAQLESWYRGRLSRKIVLGATLLELMLAFLTSGVIVMGLYSQLRLSQLRSDEQNSIAHAAPVKQLQSRIERILKDNFHDPSTLLILANWSASEGLSDLATELGKARDKRVKDWKEPVWLALQAINRRIEQESQYQAALRTELKAVDDNLSRTFVLAIILSVGALLIVRAASNQRQQLKLAKTEGTRHRTAYEQVAQNLPIGFYTFRNGRIEDANQMWDQQVTKQAGEDRMLAIERVLTDLDRRKFVNALNDAEQNKSSFHLNFNIHSSLNEIRHFETRGVYVCKPDEGLESLLGFFLDITDVVQVTDQLQASNEEVSAKNFMLSKALGDLESNLEAMVHGLVKAVEAKDPYTAGHSERVMRYSVRIGEELGMSVKDLRILERGALIHDVGKIGVPDAILMKPGRLDDQEFEVIKKHSLIGASMIQGIPVFEDCLPIVLSHHERLDGRGYPHGLIGDEIPLMVRISSVADVFDALTSTRAYRASMEMDVALEILRKDASLGALDKKIVEVLADIVMREGILDSSPQSLAA